MTVLSGGEPVAGAEVFVEIEGRTLTAFTSSDGRVVFAEIPEEELVLAVYVNEKPEHSAIVDAARQRSYRVDLKKTVPRAAVKFVVISESKPVKGALVVYSTPSSKGNASSNEKGEALAYGLPGERMRYEITAAGYKKTDGALTVVDKFSKIIFLEREAAAPTPPPEPTPEAVLRSILCLSQAPSQATARVARPRNMSIGARPSAFFGA